VKYIIMHHKEAKKKKRNIDILSDMSFFSLRKLIIGIIYISPVSIFCKVKKKFFCFYKLFHFFLTK
jgi:hypothetical protein